MRHMERWGRVIGLIGPTMGSLGIGERSSLGCCGLQILDAEDYNTAAMAQVAYPRIARVMFFHTARFPSMIGESQLDSPLFEIFESFTLGTRTSFCSQRLQPCE